MYVRYSNIAEILWVKIHLLPSRICIIKCPAIVRSRHTVVCCAAQKPGAHKRQVCITGVKKTPFSCISSSTFPAHEISMWIRSGWGTSNSKFELNLPSHSQDMDLPNLSYFLHIFLLLFAILFKIDITHACFDRLPWNLEHYQIIIERMYDSAFVGMG